MAHLQYPTSASVSSPLFLSKEKLFKLDKIIADHLPQIETENEKSIEADFDRYYASTVALNSEKGGIEKKKYLKEKLQERTIKGQARELLKSGVNASNDKKALEILLAIESGYEAPPSPPSSSPRISRRSTALVIGTFLCCLIFSFPPRSVLGIGRGEKVLQRWNWWLKFISVSVPGYLASIYLWPRLAALLSWILK